LEADIETGEEIGGMEPTAQVHWLPEQLVLCQDLVVHQQQHSPAA
jgi:hypothetical protein